MGGDVVAARGALRADTRAVEFLGPAGSGKSTLIAEVGRTFPQVRSTLRLSRASTAARMLSGAARGARAHLAGGRQGRFLSRHELRSFAYLELWPTALARQRPVTAQLFDHGPVFRLAVLGALGPPLTRRAPFVGWWNAQVDAWRSRLTAIVWLDAPDDVLMQRVRAREQRHELEHLTESAAHRFLADYREAYRDLLERMAGSGGPQVIRFDTRQASPGTMCRELAEVGVFGT